MEPATIYTLQLSAIVVLGILSMWVSSLLRIPSILLLLIVGVLAAPVFGWLEPQKTFGNLLVPITSLSVAIILFEGGLSMNVREIRSVGTLIWNISTFGAAVTFGASYCLFYYILGFSIPYSLLQSAVLMITGPTVITPMLNQLHVKQPVRSVLNWEAIIIDPIGAITAVVIFEGLLYQAEYTILGIIAVSVVKAVVIGVVLGGLGAFILLWSMRKYWVADELHGSVTLMFVILIFMCSNLLHPDAGLLSVTIMGVMLANQTKVKVSHIIDFKENLRIILISFLFIMLAGIIDLQKVKETAALSFAILLFLVFVARPLSVFLSGAFYFLPRNQALFMCSIAPRGIVCAIIASLFEMRLSELNYGDAAYLTPITFSIIMGTVVFYGVLAPWAARWLHVSSIEEIGVLIVGANPLSRAIGKVLQKEGFEVELIEPHLQKATAAKKDLLPVYRGTFLEYENANPQKLDEMNMMLAMTENNDVNSMAVIQMRSHFDEEHLYQLPRGTKKIEESLMGRQLFHGDYNYNVLSDLVEEGYIVKSTLLSEEFTIKDWEEEYEERNAVILFHIRPNGVLVPHTTDLEETPTAGSTIIFLCEEE